MKNKLLERISIPFTSYSLFLLEQKLYLHLISSLLTKRHRELWHPEKSKKDKGDIPYINLIGLELLIIGFISSLPTYASQ